MEQVFSQLTKSVCLFDLSAPATLAARGPASLRDRKIHCFCAAAIKIDSS